MINKPNKDFNYLKTIKKQFYIQSVTLHIIQKQKNII